MEIATHATYARIFEDNPDGVLILQELLQKFGQATYVPGGPEGDRATCFRSGEKNVLEYIMTRLEKAKYGG